MGKLVYGGQSVEFSFDDRALFHLQLVIANKLRRGESFLFTWRNESSVGDGRSTIWIDRSIPMCFTFYGSKPPTVNAAWLEVLTDSANSAAGMVLSSEPPAP